MVSCAKTAEPIEMPFWIRHEWAQGWGYLHPPYSIRDAKAPRERGNFRGRSGHSKALTMQRRFLVRCKMDHSIANNVM